MPIYRGSNQPLCPHCGYLILDSCELFSDMEETAEVNCPQCEEPFSMTRSVVFYYDADIEPQEQQP